MSTQGFRPPQWANTPAMVSISYNATPATQSTPTNLGYTSDANPDGVPTLKMQSYSDTQAPMLYVFDAVLELEHEQRLTKTQHPIETGADISSHAYLQPARLVMYIGMSDAMAAYVSPSGVTTSNVNGNGLAKATPFSGTSKSKSVNAYQTMLSIQAQRLPLTVTTRLRTYTNMLVTGISPREDFKTITGLRMRVEFEQIYTASTSSTPNSARPDATQSTGQGTVNPAPVPAATQQQFQYPPYVASATISPQVNSMIDVYNTVNTPGAGLYTSVAGQAGLNTLMGIIP
jgi:hypothetical protein